jgi:hypothetical protein
MVRAFGRTAKRRQRPLQAAAKSTPVQRIADPI